MCLLIMLSAFVFSVAAADEPGSGVAGKYTRIQKAKNENANLEVKEVPGGKVHVIGLSLWGPEKDYGPNMGALKFVAPIKNGRLRYSDRFAKGRCYKLELQFHKDGLIAREERVEGYFGTNVTFEGEYRKECPPVKPNQQSSASKR